MSTSATERVMTTSAKDRLRTPLLFPCAARVKMPQLGSEDSDLKLGQKSSRYAPDSIVFRTSGEPNDPISKDYLKQVSTDLNFEEEVVKERCFHALPYDEKYMYEVFEIGDLVALPQRTRMPVGRHNARGEDSRHMPCNLTKSTKSHLKPLKRKITERAQQMHIEAVRREELREIQRRILAKQEALERLEEDIEEELEEGEEDDKKEGIFLTEPKPLKDKAKDELKLDKTKLTAESTIVTEKTPRKKFTEPPETVRSTRMTIKSKSQSRTAAELLAEDESKAEMREKNGNEWDAYVMSLLSTNTANWIVYERTPAGSEDREKLENLLKKWYGVPDHTDLVREDTSDQEMEQEKEEKKPKKKWKKKESTLLQRVYNLEEDGQPHALDPYSDDNKAPFYRQPAGLRRARKHEEKEELGAINTTAANLEVKTFKPPPPPTLRDFMNPNVGKCIIETNNMFQQEQLTGTEQVYEAFSDPTKILMETNNKYKKSLQPEFPQPPETWFPETDDERQESFRDKKKQSKQYKGHQRWKTLPEPIDNETDARPFGYDAEFFREPSPNTMKAGKRNKALMRAIDDVKSLNFSDRGSPVKKYNPEELLRKLQEKKRLQLAHDPKFIIDEWRTKWHLTGQFVDSTPDDLIKDMADIQPHVRLKAIATCAKASEYKPPEDHGIQLEYMGKEDPTKTLPEKLFVALECLLDDPVEKVKTAAAITLYSLNRPRPAAEQILYKAMASENPVDRWAAAQCLAHYGVCDSDVVGEILKQVMSTEDTIKHERGISMLGILSISSNLVHAMVAEQLNSSSWRHKIIACKILPTLRGDINRDITNKLSDLMWNDWHSEVRRAAAQCLGKTGHGRDVHDDLRKKILEGDEKTKLEALNKVGQLGIMTAKLLPAFLLCFDDEYVAVRSEVCITCGNLTIKDEEVIAKLIQLATFDNIWKIKALAFQALGKIGLITEQIIDSLLWAVRYEENPGVRAEACHTLKALKVKTEEVADVLQDRFLVESNPLVRDELASTLKMFDISLTEDMDMVAQIKKEVKKLCTRNIIATQITLNEQDSDKRENLARMIYESEQDMKTIQSKPKSRHKKKKNCRVVPPSKVRLHHSHMAMDFYKVSHEREKTAHHFAVVVHKQEHEVPQEPIMERIRSISRVESTKSEGITPDPIRETVFTPSADQELEAILCNEDLDSGKTSPTLTDMGTTPGTTPGSKSRGTSRGTSASTRVPDGEDDDDDDVDIQETEDEGKTPGISSESRGSRSAGVKSGDDFEIAKVTQDNERPTSTVKFAAHLEVADIPSRSRSSLGPSRMSLMDEHGKPSRTSMGTGTTGTEGMVFGRDAVIEREKINEEARNTFAVMDLRYKDMVQDLIDLDNAFELGLTVGSRKDFEEKIQSMRIVKTPPSSSGQKSKVELTVADNAAKTGDNKETPENATDDSIKDTETKITKDMKESESAVKVDQVNTESVLDKETVKDDGVDELAHVNVETEVKAIEDTSSEQKDSKQSEPISIIITDTSEIKPEES